MTLQLPTPTSVQIQVGNFNQTIATLQLGGSETAIIVSIVICSVLLLLSVVGEEPPPTAPGGQTSPTCPQPRWRGQIEEKARGLGVQLEYRLGVGTSAAPRGGVRGRLATAQMGRRTWILGGGVGAAVGPGARQRDLEPGSPVRRELLKVIGRGCFREVNLVYTPVKAVVIEVIHSGQRRHQNPLRCGWGGTTVQPLENTSAVPKRLNRE